MLIIQAGIWSTITADILWILVYTLKPRSAQYPYSDWSNEGKPCILNVIAFLAFWAFEFFTKTVNISAYFFSHTWFLLSITYLIVGMGTVRYLINRQLFSKPTSLRPSLSLSFKFGQNFRRQYENAQITLK